MNNKWYLLIFVFLAAGIILINQGALASNSNVNLENLKEELALEENAEIVGTAAADLTGDGTEDKLILLGNKLENSDSPFRDKLKVIVKPEGTGRYLSATYNGFCGYEPEVLLKDFTGDEIAEVMVAANSGGSGGVYYHLIATFKGGQGEVIFAQDDNHGLQVTGKFLSDFKAKLNFGELEEEVILNLGAKKQEYVKQKVYNEAGDLIKKDLVRPYSYPFSKLEPVHYNRDGKYELRGIQKIVGTCGADTISEVTSIWAYEASEWHVKVAQYSTFLKLN